VTYTQSAEMIEQLMSQLFDMSALAQMPQHGLSEEMVIAELKQRQARDPDMHSNRLFGLVYQTEHPELERVVAKANEMYLWGNALNILKFPNLTRLEFEVVSMVGDLLHLPRGGGGTMTTGGTESILMSMLVNRERAKARGVAKPQILAPYSAHPAYTKAAKLLEMEYVTVPLDVDYRADVPEARKRVTPRTAVIVANAMSFPYSSIDPIPELAALAAEHGIGCHVDACIGGFVLPFLERLGYAVPSWDFRVPGVTEISADVHKYGYASKGSSVILHRDSDWVQHQFFMFSDWPSGLYGTPAVPGARPATGMATAWAVMKYLGVDGYTELIRQAMETTLKIQQSIQAMPELYIVGKPVGTTFAFGSHPLDIHGVGDRLAEKGWHLDRNVEPPSLHMMVSPGHRLIVEQFSADLQQAVAHAK
jgi:sphinganine-1-phosphate aldolase